MSDSEDIAVDFNNNMEVLLRAGLAVASTRVDTDTEAELAVNVSVKKTSDNEDVVVFWNVEDRVEVSFRPM